MLPLVMLILLVVLSYFFYRKYVTPPFPVDTVSTVDHPVKVMHFGASPNQNQVMHSSNLRKSPIGGDQTKAQSVQSEASTAQSAISNEAVIPKPCSNNSCELTVSGASPASTVDQVKRSESNGTEEKKTFGEVEKFKFVNPAAENEKLPKDVVTLDLSQSIVPGDEKTPASTVPLADSGNVAPNWVVQDTSVLVPSSIAPIVVESDGNIQNGISETTSSSISVPLEQPSSNTSDTPYQKKSHHKKKLDTGDKKKKKKKHGSKTKTYDSKDKNGEKKNKSHGKKKKKRKSERDNSTSPKDGSEQMWPTK